MLKQTLMQYVLTEQHRRAAVAFTATILRRFARAPLPSVRTQTNKQTNKWQNHLTPDVEQKKERVK
jgi:hypothetical protein